jgi:preprotein translocase subunit SecA
MERRTDAELRALTDQFRVRLAAGEGLDELMVDAFATARETAKRTVDMKPFEVQLVGGVVLHQGKVAEMRTGEGKTLVATMPIYLNALLGRGVHLVTVNDYLARRDTLWMGPIYHLLGLSVGLLQSGAEQPAYLYEPEYQRDPYPGLRPVPRRVAYAADVTYGTNNEFGFDYLRDNLALSLDRRVQRPLYYAIVDEVDNIFIDEARTPLIISGPSGESVEDYSRFASIARKLEHGVHYELDDKERSVYLTDEGLAVVEQETGIENIYDEANYRYVHYMQQALKAHVLFLEGRDYIRQRKNIILIDHHTGRLMPNRRLSEGLHQAIEAKEGVPIRPRDVTSATITIQNYFRMYEKLAGMSGTAVTEAEEFFKIYNLDVVAIPTNKPVIRADHADVVYRSEEAKFRAVAREILNSYSQGQPVLVGTTSVEMSERLSTRLTGERLEMAAMAPRAAYALQEAELTREERAPLRETMNASLETMNATAWRRMMRALDLDPNARSTENLSWLVDYLGVEDSAEVRRRLEHALREGIDHDVLNAKEHTREAAIIAKAGEPGAVTIATNMAGRGVDIKLGGELSEEVIHKAHHALRSRGIDPFVATGAQMDSAIAEVVPQYARRREQVLGAGGLHILGTERHEARRIDNQLRGRSGRQGEPGSSRFYLSLEDDLMRRFGRKEMLSKLMEQIGDDFPIEHGLVSKTIERAQTSVEGYNFDIRKHLLEYDDVLNRQRETIYGERLRILEAHDLREQVWHMLEGQVDEYVDKYGDTADQRRLLFAGLDDMAPLILPPPNAPFQGPLSFGGQLTAFPPFSISFLADQLAERPVEEVRAALGDLVYRAATDFGNQIVETVRDTSQAIQEKYDEQLGRYQVLLDEKIDDYVQLMEERGQPVDPRRLAQHLERTYPFRLSLPRDGYEYGLEELREHWLSEIEVEYHRQACAALVERVQIRLPAEVRLDRLRPARIPPTRHRNGVAEEMQRVLQLAVRRTSDEAARTRLEQYRLPDDAAQDPVDLRQVADFVALIKDTSSWRSAGIDFGQLDRLVSHILGAYLDQLLGQYVAAVDEEEVRLRRDLERLQSSVVEGQKGGRAAPLPALLGQLNGLVHLELADLEYLLAQAVAHEYDKWAQRQLGEIGADIKRTPLVDTNWASIAEHLLETMYAQKQRYDRGHRRRATWLPRLPLSLLPQAHVLDWDVEALRDEVLASLRWAVEQREKVWGQQEFGRWAPRQGQAVSLADLDEDTYDSLARYLGEEELGDLRQARVEDLPPHLYDLVGHSMTLRRWQEQGMTVGDLPQAEAVLGEFRRALEQDILAKRLGELDEGLQRRVLDLVRPTGLLDDPQARANLLEQPVSDWDRRTKETIAAFWGRRIIDAHKDEAIDKLEPELRSVIVAYLQEQRRFVDEAQVQRFLVHERLVDLSPEAQEAALDHLARSRLDRVSRRKLSNLDVGTREVVVGSLQRLGLFTDESRQEELLGGTSPQEAPSLADLEPKVQDGFSVFLAQEWGDGRPLGEFEAEAQEFVLGQLKQTDALGDPERAAALADRPLTELDGAIAGLAKQRVVERLQPEPDKMMEELPSFTRDLVHRVLEDRDYFVDQEKASWYERKTVAQIPAEILHGLEVHVGQIRLAEIADRPFQSLPAELRESLLGFLDQQGLLTERAARLRLTQTGTLGELPDQIRDQVAMHLGRQWLVTIRDQRPPTLPEFDQEILWTYLRSQAYFVDEFKEELFPYQRIDEFDPVVRQETEKAVVQWLSETLDSQPVGDLPPDLRASVEEALSQADFFVDQARLQKVRVTPVRDLPDGLRQTVEHLVGSYLLRAWDDRAVVELPVGIRDALRQYLDEIGYFVSDKKRSRIMEQRLADLEAEVYSVVVADLASHFRGEVGDRLVADLDEELRQGLREALEALGHFASEEVRARVLSQSLGSLRREDLDVLAVQLGLAQLEAWGDRSLGSPKGVLVDLCQEEREAIVSHLQARDWFLDQDGLEALQAQPLRELEAGVRQEILDTLGRQHEDHLRRRRLADLDRAQRRQVRQILQEQGAAFDQRELRSLERRSVKELDREVYRDLLWDLGTAVMESWGTGPLAEMPEDQRSLLQSYLGRRIMGRIERRVLLHTISRLWIDYLTDIEDLRRGIGLEAYGQRDPLIEYKRQAFELFEELRDNIRRIVARSLLQQMPEPLGAP